jgi:hypothetical protein
LGGRVFILIRFNSREIGKFVCISSAHITEVDSRLLSQDSEYTTADGLVVDEYGEGFWVRVPSRDDMDSTVANCRSKGYSEAFIYLIQEAQIKRISLIQIDCDGPIHKGFIEFDW